MFGTHFYHQRIRKSVAVFGTLFNNLYALRKDASGNVISQVKVPLSYGPARKFLARIRENPDLDTDTKVAIKLPRMSFEVLSIQYDQGRQLQKTNTFTQAGTSFGSRKKFYSFVPYNIGFQLSIFAKNQDDALQLVEQILPYFNPQYTVTIKPVDGYPNIKEDMPIALTGVDFSDDYESPIETRRTIIYTLTFDMKINFYGPVTNSNVIRTAITNISEQNRGLLDSDQPVAKFRTRPKPFAVSADSDFSFMDSADYNYLFDFGHAQQFEDSAGYSGPATVTYNVTVSADGYAGNKFYIAGLSGAAPLLTLTEGSSYRFDQSNASNSGHPFKFSTTANGTHGSGVEFTSGVTYNGIPGQPGSYTQIIVPTSTPTLYYYCSVHSGMGGQANTP